MATSFTRMLALCALLAARAAPADGFALGLKAGTLGLGLEGTYGLSERFSVRVGLNAFTIDVGTTTGGVRYDAELALDTGVLLLDWHPFGGIFRTSLGYVRNDNVLRLTATPTRPQEIGGITFQPEQIGTLSGEASYEENVPYFGIGWGNGAQAMGLDVNIDVGAIFHGSSRVNLESRGGQFTGNPVLEEALRREEREAEQDLDDFDVYPVVSFGLSYRF